MCAATDVFYVSFLFSMGAYKCNVVVVMKISAYING